MKNILIISFVVLTLVVVLVGCRREDNGTNGENKELTLYCGAGIRPPVEQIVEAFSAKYNVNINTDYAGSETLLSKLTLSGIGDLYLPGDSYYVNQASERGMIIGRKPVFFFIPCILVQKGNPKGINTVQDLLKPGVRVGLGDPKACAIGRLTKKILTKNNIEWSELQSNLKFKSLTVNELGIQIQAGSLDAVLVWDAVAEYYDRYGDKIKIDPAKNIISSVDIGILEFTKNEKMSRRFVEFLTSEQASNIFKKHNYTVQKPEFKENR
jgi:molybdate transport system substrate-binding protein